MSKFSISHRVPLLRLPAPPVIPVEFFRSLGACPCCGRPEESVSVPLLFPVEPALQPAPGKRWWE